MAGKGTYTKEVKLAFCNILGCLSNSLSNSIISYEEYKNIKQSLRKLKNSDFVLFSDFFSEIFSSTDKYFIVKSIDDLVVLIQKIYQFCNNTISELKLSRISDFELIRDLLDDDEFFQYVMLLFDNHISFVKDREEFNIAIDELKKQIIEFIYNRLLHKYRDYIRKQDDAKGQYFDDRRYNAYYGQIMKCQELRTHGLQKKTFNKVFFLYNIFYKKSEVII